MEDLLTLIAELSVAIAGFTAVFTVLDSGRGEDVRETALQLMRVKQMLLGGVTTAVACVVALGLIGSPLERTTVWRLAGGSTVIALLIEWFVLDRQIRREAIFQAPGYNRAHAAVIYGLCGVSVLLLVATVARAGDPIAPVLFTVAMIAMFTVSATQFARAAIKQFAASRPQSRAS